MTGRDTGSSNKSFDDPTEVSGNQYISIPFGDALCSTSEFLAILFCYHSGETGSKPSEVLPSQRLQDTNASSCSLINFSCVSSVLSSYLRVIAIFECLMHRLYERQCANRDISPGFATGLQTLNDLHLADFPVQERNLQTKILMQAIQHQLELIEEILGLPVELRFSDRQETYH